MAVTGFARDVCGMEIDSAGVWSKILHTLSCDLMPDQEDITDKGGTMRLGSYPCKVVGNSYTQGIWQQLGLQASSSVMVNAYSGERLVW